MSQYAATKRSNDGAPSGARTLYPQMPKNKVKPLNSGALDNL